MHRPLADEAGGDPPEGTTRRVRSFELDVPLGSAVAEGTIRPQGAATTTPLEVLGSPEPVLGDKRTVWFRLRARRVPVRDGSTTVCTECTESHLAPPCIPCIPW